MSAHPPEIRRFRVAVSEADWLAAYWLVIRHYWLWERITLAFAGLWLAFGGTAAGLVFWNCGCAGDVLMNAVLDGGKVAAAVCIVFTCVIILFTPRAVRKSYAEEARLNPDASSKIEFDDAGLRVDTGNRTLSLAWSGFTRWHENTKVMVPVVNEREIVILPKPQIDDKLIDELRNHLIAAQVERGLT